VAECDEAILEAEGTITVIPRGRASAREALARLDRPEGLLTGPIRPEAGQPG